MQHSVPVDVLLSYSCWLPCKLIFFRKQGSEKRLRLNSSFLLSNTPHRHIDSKRSVISHQKWSVIFLHKLIAISYSFRPQAVDSLHHWFVWISRKNGFAACPVLHSLNEEKSHGLPEKITVEVQWFPYNISKDEILRKLSVVYFRVN